MFFMARNPLLSMMRYTSAGLAWDRATGAKLFVPNVSECNEGSVNLSTQRQNWKSLLTSYPPSGIEVCEPEEAEGDRRPAGGKAGRRARSRLPALWPLPLVTLIWCVR